MTRSEGKPKERSESAQGEVRMASQMLNTPEMKARIAEGRARSQSKGKPPGSSADDLLGLGGKQWPLDARH